MTLPEPGFLSADKSLTGMFVPGNTSRDSKTVRRCTKSDSRPQWAASARTLRSRLVADESSLEPGSVSGAAATTVAPGVSRTASAAPDVRPFEYDDISVADLIERLKSGSLYSRAS